MKLKLSLSILLAILLPLSINVLAAHSTGLTLPGGIVPLASTTPPPASGTPPPATGTPPPTIYDTTTKISCPPSKTYTGSSITPCTATVTSTDPNPLWSGSATIVYSPTPDINVGPVTATATYAGDATHNPSGPDSSSFNIIPATSKINISCADAVYSGGAQQTCTASYSSSDGSTGSLPVGYSNNTDVGQATGSTSYAGDSNHDSVPNTDAHFNITKAPSTVVIQCPTSGVPYNGSAQTPCSATFSTPDGLGGNLQINYSGNTNAGTANASASYAGDSNHASGTASTT